ncbi:MAG: hypothetical protein IJX96_04995 [Clostridia bacterium]|nr:hypothetical protein [Clostridia bacterium]
MNKKHTLKKSAALFLGLALTVGATGCNFLVPDSEKDLAQIVATVDITANLEDDQTYASVASGVDKLIEMKGLSTDIPKRDLVAYFLNVGYTYVNSYGYSYEETFNMLMDGLVNQKILTQFAVAYYLKNGFTDEETGTKTTVTADNCIAYVNAEIEAASGKEKELLKAHPEVLTMKYFLTEGNNAEKTEDYLSAVYTLKKSLNTSLDSAENVTGHEHDHTHEESRTTPTNVNTEKSDYIPMKGGELDYDVYTGRNAQSACGVYEPVEGSTATTRKKAYNSFLSNLQSYGLIQSDEDTAIFTELNYYYVELSSSLGQALASKYLEDLNDEAIKALEQNDYAYVTQKYNEIKAAQQNAYTKDPTAFDTALDGVSDDSFVLYGEKDFGFVYNILLPFSASQEMAYSAAKNKGLTIDGQYKARKALLSEIEAKDLRGAWICEDEHTNYGYEVTAASDKDYYGAVSGSKGYLFFENNLKKNDQYEELKQYAGLYPYQGTIEGDKATPTGGMTIDKFIDEMNGYINFVVGSEVASGNKLSTYELNADIDDDAVNDTLNYDVDNDGNVDDFGDFIYYVGKVELANTSRSDFFYAENNDAYKALSAVNELMFAYSTDTGCLNTYMGYVVSPYKTDFVSEFEYAAQYAVQQGVGTYVVAPSDYGWHIIYTAFVYDADDGDVYGGFKAEDVEKEGTFSNLFYESLKSTSATNYTTDVQNTVLNAYKSSATRYVSRYQDLLDLE